MAGVELMRTLSAYSVRSNCRGDTVHHTEKMYNREMPTEQNTADEPARTLRLLWRASIDADSPRRGPRPKISVDAVVDAAVALADEKGIDAVTMRAVADRVGVGVMTLYGYIPGRDELLGLMIDQIAMEGERPPHTGTMRERLVAVADEQFDECRRHPWIIDARLPRPWIGPGGSSRYEWQVAAIDREGFDDITMDQIVTAIVAYVQGAARHWAGEQERLRLAESDLEWWTATGAVLDEVMDGSQYPISGRVGQAAGEDYGLGDAERSYRFGRDALISGIEQMRDTR